MKFSFEEWRSREGVELPPWNALHAMDQAYFPNPWQLEQWQQLALNGRDSFLLWSLDQGFALWELDNFPNAYLLKICVATKWRKLGVASALMQSSIDYFQMHSFEAMALEVNVNNVDAINFYHKWSFRDVRRVTSFYHDGSDALTMVRGIP